jgi:hypothetical protein
MSDTRNVKSFTEDLFVGVDPAWINAPLGAPLQALSNDKTSNLWWYTENVPGHHDYFWLHNAETVDVIGINPQGGIRSGSQLQSQRQASTTSQYWTIVEVPQHAGYFWLKSASGDLVIDINNRGGIRSGSALQVLAKEDEPNQWWSWVEVPTVSAAGLGGFNNFFLFGGYGRGGAFIALNEVTVTITITEDLIGTPPFSFQLNCWSPKPNLQEQRTDGDNYDVWQQYGLAGAPGSDQVHSLIENWSQNDPTLADGLFEITGSGFWTLADNDTKMAAGTVVQIMLSQLNGSTGPISGSIVVVGDASSAASQPLTIIGKPLLGPVTLPNGTVVTNPGSATSQDLAPIAAMQLNIVAYGTPSGQPSPTTAFTSGKGTIEYFSTTPMTVVTALPTDAAPGPGTAENSNATYGALPQGTSKLYVQTFGHG